MQFSCYAGPPSEASRATAHVDITDVGLAPAPLPSLTGVRAAPTHRRLV